MSLEKLDYQAKENTKPVPFNFAGGYNRHQGLILDAIEYQFIYPVNTCVITDHPEPILNNNCTIVVFYEQVCIKNTAIAIYQ